MEKGENKVFVMMITEGDNNFFNKDVQGRDTGIWSKYQL